jgi:DUF438 domain-containing protein
VKINKNTKILELIEKNPALIDVLVGMSPEFKKLKNPLLRKTLGRFATLEHAAEMSKIPYDELHRKVTECMIHAAGGEEKSDLSPEERARRMESLKGIIRGLHEGKAVEEQKAEFARLLGEVSASEIAEMEQSLIKEGISEEQIKKLCDVHVQVFAESFEVATPPSVPPGHPVDIFRQENEALGEVINRIRPALKQLETLPDEEAAKEFMENLLGQFRLLAEVEYHYLRKENQLFPMFEKHGITGPSKVMWALHNDIREMFKRTLQAVVDENREATLSEGKTLVTTVSDMIYKEENILFPMAMETLSESEWGRVQEGGEELGFTLIEPEDQWKPAAGPEAESPPVRSGAGEAPLWLSTGGLTPKQLDLILTTLPVDITFVDADDKVQYYSAQPERIFPRSPGIIGREVANCHPPSSVHVVEKILEGFKGGEKDTAEFWLQLGGKFIYIRYYAIRDEEGVYQGCLEVSQDVTGIRALEGERRLLDW